MRNTAVIFSHLMPYNSILVVRTVIRTVGASACEKCIHLILVQLSKAAEAIIILVVNIIHTAFTLNSVHHTQAPFRSKKSGNRQQLRICKSAALSVPVYVLPIFAILFLLQPRRPRTLLFALQGNTMRQRLPQRQQLQL